jgi:hypothetical protein
MGLESAAVQRERYPSSRALAASALSYLTASQTELDQVIVYDRSLDRSPVRDRLLDSNHTNLFQENDHLVQVGARNRIKRLAGSSGLSARLISRSSARTTSASLSHIAVPWDSLSRRREALLRRASVPRRSREDIDVWPCPCDSCAAPSKVLSFSIYPSLTREDIQACLAFGAEMTKERVLPIEADALYHAKPVGTSDKGRTPAKHDEDLYGQ